MLSGIKILSFTHYLQGPSAVQTLADLGAEVVKVEPTKGAYERGWSGCNTYPGGVSMFFLLGNRNQNSLAIDLKSEQGKEAIYKLVQEYDVIIENFRPGVMDRLGLGYETLKEINPKIIYCSCSGYGSTGPYVNKPGQDLLLQSASGLVNLSGNREDRPSPVGTPVVDQHGAILAALGVVTAIYDRSKTGKGHLIEASLLGSAMDLQLEALGYYLNGGQFTDRPTTGLSSRFHQSPYGVYSTKDGFLTFSLIPVEKLSEICTPGVFEGYTRADQMDKRLEFDAIVSEEFKKKTTAEWIELCEQHNLWYAPVNTYDDLLEDEQVKFNNNIHTIQHDVAGPVRLVGHANKYDGAFLPIRKNPPELGDYTVKLFEEMGYSNEEIERLIEEGVIFAKRKEQ